LDILLIDKSEHFEFICSQYKSICYPDFFDEVCVPNDEAVKSFGSDSVRFKQAVLEDIQPKNNTITVVVEEG